MTISRRTIALIVAIAVPTTVVGARAVAEWTADEDCACQDDGPFDSSSDSPADSPSDSPSD